MRGRRLVDGPGHLLLAGARLAADEHGRGGVGDVADQLEDVVHLRALAQHVLERVPALELLRRAATSSCRARSRRRPLDEQAQVLRVGRLGQEVVRPHPHRLDGVVDAAVAGGHDHGDRESFAPGSPRSASCRDNFGIRRSVMTRL